MDPGAVGGPVTRPILEARQARRFTVVVSQPMIDELNDVWLRPRLRRRIHAGDVERLLEQLYLRGEMVELTTVPPRCRDPQDNPVLATAIDGHADAIVTGDDDLRADEELRTTVQQYKVALW